MDLQLEGRIALVTGSDRRTGEVIAETLEREGAQVIYHGNQQAPARATSICGDIASEAGCARVVDSLQELALSPDILVNNYGTADRHTWQDADSETWLTMYQVNVLSAARLIRALVPAMQRRGWGRVVNLGTIGSHQPNSIMPGYYAAKGALATMGVSLTRELANSGITVNTVSPGYIRTEQVEAAYRKRAARDGWGDSWEDIVRHIVAEDFPNPTGRIAERQEVADLVAFLCSPLADFINGQNIRIDGGAVSYV